MSIRRCALLLFIACTPACNDVTSMDGTAGNVQIEQVTLLDHPSDRYIEVHGVVRNAGAAPLNVTVRATVLGADGSVLGSWRTPVPLVPAGGSSRFQSYVLVEGRKSLASRAEAEVESVRPAS